MRCDIVISISIIRNIDESGDTMTENEKLDLILFEMRGMKEDVQNLKNDVQGLKEDVQSLKEEVQDLKEDMQTVKEDVQDLKEDVQGLKNDMYYVKKNLYSLRRQVVRSVADLRVMDEMILSEIGRVHIFLERHKADRTVHAVWA